MSPKKGFFNGRNVDRPTVVVAILIFAACVLLLNVLSIQTIKFKTYQAKVINQITTESGVKADRGEIYDCNGAILATNITARSEEHTSELQSL